jgi:uncharacterized protein (DUF433 family)
MYAGGAELAHVLKVLTQITQHKSDMQPTSKPLPDPLILVSPDGTPVFNGTDVLVRAMLEHVDAGKPLDDFLRAFPAISIDHAIAVLDVSPPPPVDPDYVPHPLIMIPPGMVSGQPVFNGTRVPIQILFDYLEAGDPLNAFLEGFPSVSRAHAVAVMQLCRCATIR